MNKNEYRRAFIMLRAAQPGYSGHVRLERRTLTASMYFIVSASQSVDTLQAMLAGQRDGAYYAAALGTLKRDRRGQLTLARCFDPRAIDGRPLEAYAWVVVARPGEPCAVVLTGNVEGSRPMDAQALRRAVEALLTPPEQPPASDLPEPDEAFPQVADAVPQFAGTTPQVNDPDPQIPDAAPEVADAPDAGQPEAPAEDIRIYTSTRMRQAAQGGQSSGKTPVREEAEAPAIPQFPETAVEVTAEEAVETAIETSVETTAEAAVDAEDEEPAGEKADAPALTAARRLGLDITRPWLGAAEPLRRLFATQSPAQASPEDGYTYVQAPMPGQSGYAESLVGLKARSGEITGLRYALAGRYAPEPPAGMEGYVWTGGGGEGFWVLDAPTEQIPPSPAEAARHS